MIIDETKLTVLVNSCDAYEDCWHPFFVLFDKYGGDMRCLNIVLNTETKSYEYPGLKVNCVNIPNRSLAWGGRVRNALKHISTPYVITFLDDFFLRRPIDCGVVGQCIEYMDNNSNIGVFYFDPIGKDCYESKKYKSFCLMPAGTPWRCATQAAIWRRDVLLNSLLDIESPWDWEQKGSIRNSTVLKKTEFYALKHHTPSPVEYGLSKTGDFGILQGKWHKSDVVPLFEKHNIKIDYSIRGFCEENTYEDLTGEPPKKRNIFNRIASGAIRPLKAAINNKRYYRSTSDKDKLMCALVLEPIKRWKAKDTKWHQYDYKKEFTVQ